MLRLLISPASAPFLLECWYLHIISPTTVFRVPRIFSYTLQFLEFPLRVER